MHRRITRFSDGIQSLLDILDIIGVAKILREQCRGLQAGILLNDFFAEVLRYLGLDFDGWAFFISQNQIKSKDGIVENIFLFSMLVPQFQTILKER